MNKVSKFVAIILCAAVLLGTTGCATLDRNPVIHYGEVGVGFAALPSVIVGETVYAKGMKDEDKDDGVAKAVMGTFAVGTGLCIIAAGAVIGGIVGLVRWITIGSLPEEEIYQDEPSYNQQNYDEPPSRRSAPSRAERTTHSRSEHSAPSRSERKAPSRN